MGIIGTWRAKFRAREMRKYHELDVLDDPILRERVYRTARRQLSAWRFVARFLIVIITLRIAVDYFGRGLTNNWRMFLNIFPTPLAIAFCFSRWPNDMHRAIAQLMERREARKCTQCNYDLRGSPPDGRCPECGREYTRKQQIEAWVLTLVPPQQDRSMKVRR